MPHVHATFTMNAPPERAQEMFVRDIVPDLHRDGRFTMYREAPGQLRMSDAGVAEPSFGRGHYGGALDLNDIADPDEFEVHDEEAGDPALADALRRGPDAETPASSGHHFPEMLFSRRLKITFEPEGGGTRVRIKGSAHDDVRKGLERLGSPGHWPEIADAPHD